MIMSYLLFLFFLLLSDIAVGSVWKGGKKSPFLKDNSSDKNNESADIDGSLVKSSEKKKGILAISMPSIMKEKVEEIEDDFKPILPRLLPHKDKCYLLEFHSDNSDHCEQMEPVLQRLERDLNTKVRRINIFRRREFQSLLETVGHDECGTLPFYYNRRTGQAICGATSYLNLKRWGTGSLKHLFQDPPENLFEMDDNQHAKRGDVGLKGAFMEKVMNFEKRGKGRADKDAKKTNTVTSKSSKSGTEAPKSAAERTASRREKRSEATKAK